jgi:NTE family protein
MNKSPAFVALLVTLGLTAGGCVAQYPVNEPITTIDTSSGYRLGTDKSRRGCEEDLLVVLAFSGGGTRAAAFSFGILEALRAIPLSSAGCEGTMLDQVDQISSVSGGSFTAAYYGLFMDRIFEDFPEKFLYANVEGYLRWSLFKPWRWPKLGSPLYGRSEFAAEYYDNILFENKTFADFNERGGPIIRINATEVSTGTQFTFSQELFDPLCTNLSTFPISRAVAASSAVPVLFSSITVNNYAGTCDFQLSQSQINALQDPDRSSRRRHLTRKYSQYLNREEHAYLHLYDGGLTDNLGVRPLLNRIALAGDAWQLAKAQGLENVKRILFIVANAQVETKAAYATLANPVPLLDTILGASSIPLNELTMESLAATRLTLAASRERIVAGRCADRAAQGEEPGDCAELEEYFIIVDLDQVPDKEKRKRLQALPTSFRLKRDEVDELRDAAQQVLLQSPKFQKFLRELE